VAGVYDARQRTLDVYLNGELDNGSLIGSVTGTQHSSRSSVYVGKRTDLEGYQFAGSIRDVRVYSLALTSNEIAAVMRGEMIGGMMAHPVAASGLGMSHGSGALTDRRDRCAVISEGGDERLPAVAATLGVVVAFVLMGLWPSARSILYLLSSCAAGLLLLPAIASTLPRFNLWIIPLASFAGGASVVASVHRRSEPTHLTH
jgi:hypothetical protein